MTFSRLKQGCDDTWMLVKISAFAVIAPGPYQTGVTKIFEILLCILQV
jgi:hypothetical protein